MARRFINQLGENESIDEVFLVWDKQLRTNRNGNLYLQLRLADRSGSVTGMMWNANERVFNGFENGDFVQVQGATQYYSGSLQMIVNHVEKAVAGKFDEADFVTLNAAEIDRMAARLAELLRGFRNYHLRNLAECFLMDEQFMERFTTAPAGIKNHHAYRGGLLEHVVSLMNVATSIAPHYPEVDPELLVIGAFLHDIGKIEELSYNREMSYTDSGQLLGHVVLAIGMVEDKIRESVELAQEPFPEELSLRLKHMILSHHGEYEYGSPKLPMTMEAIALNFIDNLDSKLHSVACLLRDEVQPDGRWTTYQPRLNRKFFKGS
jgi:3'-5' exoribonuclease